MAAQLCVVSSIWLDRRSAWSASRNAMHIMLGASRSSSPVDLAVAAAAAGNKPVQRPMIWISDDGLASRMLGSFSEWLFVVR